MIEIRRCLLLLLVLCGCGRPNPATREQPTDEPNPPIVHEQLTSDGMVITSRSGTPFDLAFLEEDYARAEQLAKQQVEREPQNPHTYIRLGHAQMMQGDYGNAALNYDKAIDLAPDNTIALYGRGLLAQEQGDFATAKQFYGRTLRVDADSPEGHYGMAAACEGLGLPKLVIKHARRFLELKGDSALAGEAKDMIKWAEHDLKAVDLRDDRK